MRGKSGKNKFLLPSAVTILYSESRREYFPTEAQYLTEKDSEKEAAIVSKYLDRLEIKSRLLPANVDTFQEFSIRKPEFILNMTGSIKGKEYLAAMIPGIAQMYSIPYSGANFLNEAYGYNKYLIKKLLEQQGIPVPISFLIKGINNPLPKNITFPCIVKLNSIHGSVEINKDSICENEDELRKRIEYLINRYQDSILVENFIEGEEFSAIGFEYNGLSIYVARNIFGKSSNAKSFASFDLQWNDEEIGFVKYHDKKLNKLIEKGYYAIGMQDYGKFDIRRDKKGNYYIIDANTNPALGPKENDCAMGTVMDLYGISFEEILKRLFTNVLRRHKTKY